MLCPEAIFERDGSNGFEWSTRGSSAIARNNGEERDGAYFDRK